MPYTYILQCADGSYYTGWTIDLKIRLRAHNSGVGARYTRGRLPVQLVYWEFYSSRSQAQQQEEKIKRFNRKQKEALVASFAGESKES